MPSWLESNILTIVLALCFLGALAWALRLRAKMSGSKARFAFASSATLASCLIAFLSFLSGSGPVWIGNQILSGAKVVIGRSAAPAASANIGWLVGLAGLIGFVVAIIAIYRFSYHAIRSWDGPVTMTVNELAKRDLDTSLPLLAWAELRRLLIGRSDPVVSDVAVNWQQRLNEAPSSPPWHEFARTLFEAAFHEASFDDTGWRDRFQCWVGNIYVLGAGLSEPPPLVMFVFDDEPDGAKLTQRIEAFVRDGGPPADTKMFAIFQDGKARTARSVDAAGCRVGVWPRRALLRHGLKLTRYARDLIREYDTEPVGGTRATLKDTFVQAHVHERNKSGRVPLNAVLDEWLSDPSRRHLAITGEYGQGKSTAMLRFCVDWARRYLDGDESDARIPLLVELRGQNPGGEADSRVFLAAWGARHGVDPGQVYNLIRSGDAIVIFEGFDELKNAGRAYDRHEHFNALWRMAFPGTKLIFTGRPNFFIDEQEKNRTLRSGTTHGIAGEAYTQLWEMDHLTREEIETVGNGFHPGLGRSIAEAADANKAFFEIVSRPSMLPVVATIWGRIEKLRAEGQELTSALLLEIYLQATYERKEAEMRRQQLDPYGPAGYLLFPREVRDLFTLAVVWKMVCIDARNTIDRITFNSVIAQVYDDAFAVFQKEGVPANLTHSVRDFEERFKDDPKRDRNEIVANTIASSGLFVPDPAGGPSNLRLPHKQYYEYLVAKACWTAINYPKSLTGKLISDVGGKNPFTGLMTEDQSLTFFAEMTEDDFTAFRKLRIVCLAFIQYLFVYLAVVLMRVIDVCSLGKIKRVGQIAHSISEMNISEMKFPLGAYRVLLPATRTIMMTVNVIGVLSLLLLGTSISSAILTQRFVHTFKSFDIVIIAMMISFPLFIWAHAFNSRLFVLMYVVGRRIMMRERGRIHFPRLKFYGETLRVLWTPAPTGRVQELREMIRPVA